MTGPRRRDFNSVLAVVFGIAVIQYGFYNFLGPFGPFGSAGPMAGWSKWNDEVMIHGIKSWEGSMCCTIIPPGS